MRITRKEFKRRLEAMEPPRWALSFMVAVDAKCLLGGDWTPITAREALEVLG